MHRPLISPVAWFIAVLLSLAPALAQNDDKMEKDKAKAKEKEKEQPKEKEKEKEKDAPEWKQVFTVSNAPGGFQHFDLAVGGKVRFSWECTPEPGVPQLRVLVAKLNERNGKFQTLGTIVSVHAASKSTALMGLEAGKYRLYVVTKFMKYTLNVESGGK